VDRLFATLELPPLWRERVLELVEEQGSRVDIERERRRLEEKIARVRRGFVDGVLDEAMAKKAIQQAEAELARLPKGNAAAVQAGQVLVDIRELWPHMTAEEKRDLVRLVLGEVTVDLREAEAKDVLPKPAFAPLFRLLSEEECGPVRICGWRPRRASGSLPTAPRGVRVGNRLRRCDIAYAGLVT